jgi:Domain of unknown function (DUF4160)
MVTVLRAQGLSFVVFVDDHEAAHVAVFGDGQAKIDLSGPDNGPALVWVDGVKRGDVRRVLKIVAAHREALLMRWREIHG